MHCPPDPRRRPGCIVFSHPTHSWNSSGTVVPHVSKVLIKLPLGHTWINFQGVETMVETPKLTFGRGVV